MTDHPRPVWLTKAQIRALAVQPNPEEQARACLALLEAWDAAPANPAEAVWHFLEAIYDFDAPDEYLTETTKAVLRALGMPTP